MPKIKDKNYVDVTSNWLKIKKNNKKSIELQMYYEDCGKFYYVDNKRVIMDYSKKELEVANWLKDTFNEKVIILPKVNWPENIQTPDYIFKGEKWDLKEMKDINSNKRAVDNLIKNYEKQSNNFIIDISSCKIDNKIIIKQVENIFGIGKFNRKWVKKIILKKGKELLGVFVRK